MSFEVWAFFTDKTIIAIPLQHTLNQVDKFGILSKRNNILGQVKKYIDNLDPNSKSFLMICHFRKFFLVWESHKMIIIGHLVLFHNGYEIYLKKSTSSCFVNNYSPVLLKAWEPNLDI